MNPLYFDDLRDIHGLDSIPWWPLAPGYWLILLAVIALIWLIRALWRRSDWRVDAKEQFTQLKRQRHRLTHKAFIAAFSELLRRIAMARYGREACAGLHGSAWLEWLEAHDPKGFPWKDMGKPLLTLPYAPDDTEIDAETMTSLLRALRHWIDAELPQTQQRKAHLKAQLQNMRGRFFPNKAE